MDHVRKWPTLYENGSIVQIASVDFPGSQAWRSSRAPIANISWSACFTLSPLLPFLSTSKRPTLVWFAEHWITRRQSTTTPGNDGHCAEMQNANRPDVTSSMIFFISG